MEENGGRQTLIGGGIHIAEGTIHCNKKALKVIKSLIRKRVFHS
jgi:hypothetical protein